MKRIGIIALLGLLVLVAGWYEGFYHHETSHMRSLKATEQQAAGTVMGLEARYASLVNSKRELPEEQAALSALRRAVPDNPALDNVVTTLFNACKKADVALVSITSPVPSGFGQSATAAAATAATGPAEISISLEVTGTGDEVTNLYRILDAEPRLFVIQSFDVNYPSKAAGGAGTGENSASLSLLAFYAIATSSNPA